MPVFALGSAGAAAIARLTRASLLQVIREDYIRTARAKGLREQTVIVIHALKNGMKTVARTSLFGQSDRDVRFTKNENCSPNIPVRAIGQGCPIYKGGKQWLLQNYPPRVALQ